jgi:hypothetical protein
MMARMCTVSLVRVARRRSGVLRGLQTRGCKPREEHLLLSARMLSSSGAQQAQFRRSWVGGVCSCRLGARLLPALAGYLQLWLQGSSASLARPCLRQPVLCLGVGVECEQWHQNI